MGENIINTGELKDRRGVKWLILTPSTNLKLVSIKLFLYIDFSLDVSEKLFLYKDFSLDVSEKVFFIYIDFSLDLFENIYKDFSSRLSEWLFISL